MPDDDNLEKIFEKHRGEIEVIMAVNQCLNDHGCYLSGLTKLCKAGPFGPGQLIKCMEENPLECPRAQSFGHSFICKCNIRNYIHNNIGR